MALGFVQHCAAALAGADLRLCTGGGRAAVIVAHRVANGDRLRLAHRAAAVALHVVLRGPRCRWRRWPVRRRLAGKAVVVRVEIRLAAILAGAVFRAIRAVVAGAGALMAEHGIERRRGISRRQGILVASPVLPASIRPVVERAAGAGRNGRGDADVAALFRGILRASPLGVAKAGDEGQLVPVRSAFCTLRLLRVENMAFRGLISAAVASRLVLLEIGGVGEKMAVLVAPRSRSSHTRPAPRYPCWRWSG